ncbi:hypothetical protein RDI58_008923 [Solanum bulbocastanum]|uniref:Chitin-binding type-1 domain-containing protein n=1 Tax=Solanum bulbocastanum TaxID=147425 RepID=A0AAN8TWR2_SOLBU
MVRITSILALLALQLFLVRMGSADSFDVPKNETLGININESYPQGRCGRQAGGRKCPPKLCCSKHGWCGTAPGYCDPLFCQSQCSGAPIPPYVSPFLTAKQQPGGGMRGIRSFLLNEVVV